MTGEQYREEVARLRHAHLLALKRAVTKIDAACQVLNPQADFEAPEKGKRTLAPLRWRFVIDGHRMLSAALEKATAATPTMGANQPPADEPAEDAASAFKGLKLLG